MISVAGLLLGLGLAFFLYTVNQKFDVGQRVLNDRLAGLSTQMVLLGQQLEEGTQQRQHQAFEEKQASEQGRGKANRSQQPDLPAPPFDAQFEEQGR